jgi:uncharacterized DUF497 family protein
MNPNDILFHCAGFEWDDDNLLKNWEKHRVSFWECEEVFFNQPLLLAGDTRHSEKEKRFYVLGKTDAERLLFAAFTIRQKRIRVISARDMSRRERSEYINAEEKDTEL